MLKILKSMGEFIFICCFSALLIISLSVLDPSCQAYEACSIEGSK